MNILFIRGTYPQTIPLTQYHGKHEIVYVTVDKLDTATINSIDIVVVVDTKENVSYDEVMRTVNNHNPDLPIVSLLYKPASSSFSVKPLYTPRGCSLRSVEGCGESAESGKDEEYELFQTFLEFNRSKQKRDSQS